LWRALKVKERKIFRQIDMQQRPFQILASALLPLSLSVLLVALPGHAAPPERAGSGRPPGTAVRPETSLEYEVSLDDDATLADYLAYAALNNPGLEAAFGEWVQAAERVAQVKSLPDPRLAYTYYIQEVETRVGPQRQAFALMQTIPWFGKLGTRGEMAGEAAEAAHLKYEAAKLRLFHRVKHSYYEYYYLARAIDITESNMTLLENLESVARVKYSAGKSSHLAVIKAQVEIGKLEDRLNSLRDLRAPTAARLNAALGRSATDTLPWPQSLDYDEVQLDEAELYRQLEDTSPELGALAHVTAREEKSVRLARKGYFPDFTLGANYIDTGQALNREMKDSGKDAFMVSLSINLPLWAGKYRSAEREARARVDVARKRHEDSENMLQADLSLALFQLRDAERRIDLYRDTLVPKAEESLSVSQRAFTSGQADFLELIDAERSLLEFQLSYERALTDHAQRLSEIEMLTGREL
jgi:outer membrane protein TolC